MKILRLDLLAFGPFTGASLVLEEGQRGLHVVYGPNEAGKSSSLRALRQLLFGIPHNSSDNFIHSHQNLRIGGLLESVEGTRLELIRRKGRTKTLRGPDDTEAIDPSRLIDMLGGIDEVTFGQRFGFDYEELSKGGEAVVRGGGDLGEILFAAGAGVADLGIVKKRLDEEADDLFKARGSNPRINKAISELTTARRDIKEVQLPTSKWVEHDEKLRESIERQAKIDKELDEKRSEKNRLERIDKALPLISRRKRIKEQLGEVVEARLLPEDFPANRTKAETELALTQQAERHTLKAIKELQDEIAKLDVPQILLEHRTSITGLHSKLGSHQKATQDRPGLVARLENSQQQARAILQDLGRGPELEQAERLRLNRAQRQRIQSLAGQRQAFHEKQSSADQSVRKLQDDIRRGESELAEYPAIRDTGKIKRAIRRAQKHGDLDQQHIKERRELRELEADAGVALDRLRLWSGTLERLECLPVPALDTIERYERELDVAAAEVEKIEERIGNLTRKAQENNQSLEQLQLEQDVPTEEDLVQSRQRRDVGWQLVQQAWHSGPAVDDQSCVEFIDEFAPGGDLSQAYQASVEAADAVADRLRREADRVAKKAKLTTDRQDGVRQLSESKKQLSLAQGQQERLRALWHDQWTEPGIDPVSPREMRSWLNQQQNLVHTAKAIRNQHTIVDRTDALIKSLRTELVECLEPLDQSIPAGKDTLSQVLEHCETVVEAIESATRLRQECETNLQTQRDKLPEAKEQAEQAKSNLEQWQSDWAKGVAVLGLHPGADPSEANSVIESVDELFGLLKDTKDLQNRVDGIDRDADEFAHSVERLVTQVAEDLAKLPVDQAVADLYDRLDAANTAQTKLDGWKKQLDTEHTKSETTRSKVKQLEAMLEVMCQQAGCTSPDDLSAAEGYSAQRRENEKDLKTVNEQLDGLTAGGPLNEFIAETEQFDSDRLRADLFRLGQEIAELEDTKREVAETIGGHRNELQRMDGSGRAAEAQEKAEHLLSVIRSNSEQYIRFRLASAVLRRSIERFREASQGPVLARAGELFADLTLGSFTDLRTDYDDKGNPILVGVRAGGGQTVSTNGMSSGTCDQLYLALRLALLESYLDGQDPLPFIVDDILVMFDDDRAVAALKALARLSDKTQVIFFTHHEHLVHLARQNLDDDVLFTHRLDNRPAAMLQPESS